MAQPSSSQYMQDDQGLPLFTHQQPPIPQIITDNAIGSQYPSGSQIHSPYASTQSSYVHPHHQQRHSIAGPHALSSPFPSSPGHSAPPPLPTTSRHARQGSMSSALPYTTQHGANGGYHQDDSMMLPPPSATSLGSLARSASLGRRKDPYSYSSDDVESGMGSMDMGVDPTWPGYGGRPMHQPPAPPHPLSRPPAQRYQTGSSSPSRPSPTSQTRPDGFANPYVPRGSDPGPSASTSAGQQQWTDYRRPSSNRMPSSNSYPAQSPTSEHQLSSPYLRPDMFGTSPSSPMPNPYDLSPQPTSPGQVPAMRWPTPTINHGHAERAPMTDPYQPKHQNYPASQPATPAKGYDPGHRALSQMSMGKSQGFKVVRDRSDLKPLQSGLNQGRRADPKAPGRFLSPLKCLTTEIPQTYSLCNPNFRYETSDNPRRVLTKPSKPTHNEGADNEDWDYILYVNDVLGGEGGRDRYLILDVLGQGTFGQVVKCQNMRNHEIVAVKVVKNKPAYLNQSKMEVAILDLLNKEYDANDTHHILRMLDSFTHKSHLCLVFECLSSNLYELIKQNQFKGLSTQLVKVFTQQLLDCLAVLKDARLIHCDLKPENILLKSLQSPQIKVIDFGSACHEMQTVYTYIQSRFYRSPEVLLGLPYSMSIDMWSLGCIVVELFLGLPLFPGTSEYNQVSRIVDMMGLPPTHLLEVGKQTHEFFNYTGTDSYGKKHYSLKPMEQYATEHRTKEQPSKQYFKQTKLRDIIMEYPMAKKNPKQSDVDKEMANRRAFVDFVEGLLNLDPIQRWTPQQAAKHPFITGEKFTGSYQPQQSMSKKTYPTPETPQTRPAPVASTTPASSKKYGGLVQSPATNQGQRVYSDAAAYNQQLNQHQSYTAQVQAQQNAPRQPFGAPYDPPMPQTQHSLPPQQSPYTQRVPSHSHQQSRSSHQGQWQQMPPPPQPNFGQQRIPSQGLTASASHSGIRANAAMAPQTNPPPNSYYPASRNRANTINQMDAIPPALARLTHFGAPDPSGQRNLTPVLNREDMMREWDRRQSGHSKKSSLANASYPQLEYLQEQAELAAMGGQAWMMPGPYMPQNAHHPGHAHTLSAGGSHYQMQPPIGASPQHPQSATDYRRGPSEYDPPLPTSARSQPYLPTYPPPAATSAPNSAAFDGFDGRDSSMGMLYTPLQPNQPSFPGFSHGHGHGHGHGHRASYSGPYSMNQPAGANNPFVPGHPAQPPPTSPRYQRRSQGYGA